MSTDAAANPQAYTWVAAIYSSENSSKLLGAAVVVDTDRVLTCAHVVVSADGAIQEPLWVAFPMVYECPRRRVAAAFVEHSPVKDLAVLVLQEPVPSGVEAAPLRCPKPADLANRAWWAFGFPEGDPIGDSADGTVGAALAHGWIRLDAKSRYVVRQGFSGGGLWSRDYEAVVGVVGQTHINGDGRAITLHQADQLFPDHKLAVLANSWSAEAAGEVALEQWGWTLARDPEGVRHWRPRARGVSVESERGFRFRGRTAALTRIVQWLDRAEPDRRVLVLTGSPGVGKSAVLGRIVTTADAAIRASLPSDDEAVRARLGSVSCAVHASAKTALEVAEEIARAASARLPEEACELAPAVRDALGERSGRRFNVIIDALDEAANPAQARSIIEGVVLPLVEACSAVGAQVVVGTRRRDDGGDLLGLFGGALTAIDLDEPEYFAEGDLAAYVMASLKLEGDERPGNPYADDAFAGPFASKIAEMSERNFLVAGLIARAHGLDDEKAADPEGLRFTATVDSALDAYLRRLGPVAGFPARCALTALAFAEAPGLPAELWQLAVEAIYRTRIRAEDLTRFAGSSAANFLVEAGGEVAAEALDTGAAAVWRLFHQALSDALLRARSDVMPPAYDERALTLAFVRHGRLSKWQDAPGYLLRSLPGHADAAGQVDELLGDDAYLLHADLRRLMQVADGAFSAQGRRRARLLHLTPRAITASPKERAAYFSVTEALENLGASYRNGDWDAPYHARWASVRPRVLDGHQGPVHGVCPVTVAGQTLLASVSADSTVRIWDPKTGKQRAVLEGHPSAVNGVCPLSVAGRALLASAGGDSTVRIWDPETGQQRAVLEGHQAAVYGVCPVTVAGRALLASAGGDSTVRIWDPETGKQCAVLDGHQAAVNGVCPVTVAGRTLLASASGDRTVRIWDPETGQQRAVLDGHQAPINGVCPVTVAGRTLLASASGDRTVRIWDPETGQQRAVLDGHQAPVYGVCPVTVAGRTLLASAGGDRMVRIWDPETGEQHAVLEGHLAPGKGVCPVTVAGRTLLASASGDSTVRIWDPETSEQRAVLEGHPSAINGVCEVTVAGRTLLASASGDSTVRIWDPETGEQRAVLEGHRAWVNDVCPVTVAGRTLLASRALLASAGDDGTVRIWDPETSEQRAVLDGHPSAVNGVCPVTVAGRALLASAGDDGTVRIWDPETSEQRAVLEGHQDPVHGICPVTVAGRALLASAGADSTVRIWDPETGEQRAVLEGHQDPVNGVCQVTVAGRALLASAGADSTVRIWDPETGEQRAVLDGHQTWANRLCPVTVAGRALLASAGADGTVRIWDPETRACLLTVPTHHTALAVKWTAEWLAIGLVAGILVIK